MRGDERRYLLTGPFPFSQPVLDVCLGAGWLTVSALHYTAGERETKNCIFYGRVSFYVVCAYSADSVVGKTPQAHPLVAQGYLGRTPLAVCVHSTRSATPALLGGTSVEDICMLGVGAG